MRATILSLTLFFFLQTKAQILDVPELTQEQSEWCWAGVSSCVLDYYNHPTSQCEIAEYTRNVASWHSFGSQNCCDDPTAGCNYWNWNCCYDGSLEDILINFGGVQNYNYASPLSITQVGTQITAGRPFIVRWGWNTGGGHFVVCHGKSGSNIYTMNPWFGEGMHISTYSWLLNDGSHTWTHTNIITTNLGVTDIEAPKLFSIYPNPAKDHITFDTDYMLKEVTLSNMEGRIIQTQSLLNEKQLNISSLATGSYVLSVVLEDGTVITAKIIKE